MPHLVSDAYPEHTHQEPHLVSDAHTEHTRKELMRMLSMRISS